MENSFNVGLVAGVVSCDQPLPDVEAARTKATKLDPIKIDIPYRNVVAVHPLKIHTADDILPRQTSLDLPLLFIGFLIILN